MNTCETCGYLEEDRCTNKRMTTDNLLFHPPSINFYCSLYNTNPTEGFTLTAYDFVFKNKRTVKK